MSMRTYRIRIFLLGCMSLLLFSTVIARLYYIQIIRHKEYVEIAAGQQNKTVELIPRRGDITDRNGIILATSHFSNNIILDSAKFIEQPRSALVREMAEAFQKEEPTILGYFKQPKRQTVATTLTLAQEGRIRAKVRDWQTRYKLPEGAIEFEKRGEGARAGRAVVLDTTPFMKPPSKAVVRELARIVRKPEATLWEMIKRPRRHILVRMAPEEMELELRMASFFPKETKKAPKHEEPPKGEKKAEEKKKEEMLPRDAILFMSNSERENPHGSLASHIIGYTNIDDNGDNIGKSGVEAAYNEKLKGSVSKQAVPVTQNSKALAPLQEDVIEATYGNNIVLTIDQKLQMFTERALQKRVGEVQGDGGIAIVMDVKTGELLALASVPDFNLNNYTKSDPTQMRNRTLTDPIEIGSVMKIITTTLLLEDGKLTPDEPVDCQGGRGAVQGRRMTDSHHLGVVPFREAFAASSNIALATVGLRLEKNYYYQGLRSFGLGQKTEVDLTGEGAGVLRDPERWSDLTRTSLPIGYETSLTAMEVISALGAIGNDGVRLQPHVVREIRTHQGELVKRVESAYRVRVASAETCRTVRELMEGVLTLPMGTGEKARIPGYRIGGKTGTTIKTPPGVTPKKYIASFAGLLPIQQPRLAFYVYIDDPKMGEIFGGSVSAPVFQDIARVAVQILGIAPDDPVAFAQAEQERTANPLKDAAKTSATQKLAKPTPTPTQGEDEILSTGADETSDDFWEEVATPEDRLLPCMPDCRGQTIAQAWRTLSDAGITSGVRMMGSGVATSQEPAAGAPVRPGAGVTVFFALPSEAVKSLGVQTPIHAQ